MAEQVTPAEKIVLVALLDERWSEYALEQLEAQLFEGLRTESIFQEIFQLQKANKSISTVYLRERVEDENDRNLLEELALRSNEILLSKEVIKNSMRALQKKQLERLSLQIQEKIKNEEMQDSASTTIDRLLVKKEQLRKKMKEGEYSNPTVSPDNL